jgi:hypothetical protein
MPAGDEWNLVRESLRSASIDPTDFGRFVNRPSPGVIEPSFFDSATATPVLLDWLPRVSDRGLKEVIVRHLRNPAAKGVATYVLMSEFAESEDDGLRWVLADALQYVATAEQRTLLIPLARERRYGIGRQMLFEAIGRLKTAEAVEAARRGLCDPDVALHAGAAFRRLVSADEAEAAFRALVTDSDRNVAKAAERNLKRLVRRSKRN